MVLLSASEAASCASEKGAVLLGDISVAFKRFGEGQPVIFVHGLAEDKESWSGVVARLPRGIRAHLLDLRGHGGSTVGEGNGTVSQLAGDLTAYLEEVTGPAACVGFSLGGVVALEAALQRPDLVRRAIVIGASSKVGRAAAGFFEARIQQAMSDIDGFRRALAEDTDAQVVCNRQDVAAIAARRIAAVGDGAGYVNAARAMVGLAAVSMTERLRDIRVPVHIIQGENDVFCPLKAAQIMRDAMPDAGYTNIPDAGHLIAADQPDLLARELSRLIIQKHGRSR
ncbi:pimeloyl-ACP methyl ester carboxylesterase [Pseudochelatococcus lubricantis]|uniref:Pimeloyl-ACP methyl ester carboxylesterase n=1 Tax=Pseudochelatococcus lubricantis TaxID=1538102 RepID=A0ABX0V0S6_9HYPH|nr:alpha/beta hydrolase [Pseudochelatococcus lubricantis]NIJ58771.1 pimeloyl-ACP methyl ester carboxylesterase [Pseudochelatococcus lubricantis]